MLTFSNQQERGTGEGGGVEEGGKEEGVGGGDIYQEVITSSIYLASELNRAKAAFLLINPVSMSRNFRPSSCNIYFLSLSCGGGRKALGDIRQTWPKWKQDTGGIIRGTKPFTQVCNEGVYSRYKVTVLQASLYTPFPLERVKWNECREEEHDANTISTRMYSTQVLHPTPLGFQH